MKKINIYDVRNSSSSFFNSIFFFNLFLKTNPDGVVTVGFADIDQADACCQYMNGRIWHGRVIECKTWDGKREKNLFFVF